MKTSIKKVEDNSEAKRKLVFDDFLACRMKVIVERMGLSLAKMHEQFGISPPQWMVIALLGQHPSDVAATLIKKSTAMDKSRINRTINSLVDKQLILKLRNSEDNRAYNVRLNSKGKKLFAKVEELALDWGDDLLVGLTIDEIRTLETVLTKLETNLTTIETKQESQ